MKGQKILGISTMDVGKKTEETGESSWSTVDNPCNPYHLDGHRAEEFKDFGTFAFRDQTVHRVMVYHSVITIVCRSFLRDAPANRDVSARVQAQDLHAVDGRDISCNFP